MQLSLDNLPNGPFVLDKTFVYYDAPLLFSARSENTPLVVIVNAVEEEENEEESIIWLAAVISEAELVRVSSGFSPLRETFTDAFDGTLFVLRDNGDKVEPIKSSQVPTKWLPVPGARLGSHNKEEKTDA
jgi:hypothetical protein